MVNEVYKRVWDEKEEKTYYEKLKEEYENSVTPKKFLDEMDLSKKIEKDSDSKIAALLNTQKDLFDARVLKETQPEEEKKDEGVNLEFLSWNDKSKKYVLDLDAVADYFCNEYDFVTIPNEQKDILYKFNGKFYERGVKSFIKKQCQILLGKYSKINPNMEIIAKIENKTQIVKEDFEIVNENLIPLDNGVWNIKKKKLIDHSPKNYFKTIIPIKYNEKSKCPKFFKFLEEAFYEEDIEALKEWFGFQLYRKYFIKKAVILLGETDTGKTILLEVLNRFIGEQNKTGLSLQKISGGNDFIKLSLRDKHSNIYDDLSSKDLSDGGNFKVATGGGMISAEEKFGGFYQFRSYAKHTFATNKIPPVKDNDDLAYFSRWVIFRLDNPPEKKDPFLKEKLTTEKELSGILNWALEGLYKILKSGEFSYKKSPGDVKKIMEMSGDDLIQFGQEVLTQDDGHKISKEDMYEIYCFWANKSQKPVLSKEQLGRRLNQKVTYIIPKIDKKRFWGNVNLKTDFTIKHQRFQRFNKNYIVGFTKDKNDDGKIDNMFSKKALKVLKKEPEYVHKKQALDKKKKDKEDKEDVKKLLGGDL